MDRRRLGALGLVNAALLAAAALLWQGGPEPRPAVAQGGFGGGANYTMVSGLVNGLDQQAIYVIETTSGRMVAFYLTSGGKVVPLGSRNIAEDLQTLKENQR
ncbi:MAG: hypothetical protein AAGA57_00680 [Planctomycetota bacterium]